MGYSYSDTMRLNFLCVCVWLMWGFFSSGRTDDTALPTFTFLEALSPISGVKS